MTERPSYREQLLTEYRELAPRYESRWASYLKNSHELAQSLLPETGITAQYAWLDVACGTGLWMSQLRSQLSGHLLGVDLNEGMLKQALTKEIPEASFVCASAELLPIPDNSVAAVSCLNALHYFDQAEHALDEFIRVLKPGGHLLIVDWCKDYWFQAYILPLFLRFGRHAHARTWRSKELHEALESRGLHLEATRRLRFSPVWDLMGVLAQKH